MRGALCIPAHSKSASICNANAYRHVWEGLGSVRAHSPLRWAHNMRTIVYTPQRNARDHPVALSGTDLMCCLLFAGILQQCSGKGSALVRRLIFLLVHQC